jgi:RHS repeat-associated protein
MYQRTDAAGAMSYLTDGLSSAVALLDGTGVAVREYSYEPFGATSTTGTASANSFQYTGRENDGTGLMYYRARYYSPELQRFISQDPLGFRGGDANLYGYVGNSPMNGNDPTGLFGSGVIAGVSGTIGLGGGYGGAMSIGAGVFVDIGEGGGTGSGATTASAFISGGFTAPTPFGQQSMPSNPASLFPDFALGASGGWGVGYFMTNADSVEDLRGPFTTTILSLPWFSVKLILDSPQMGDPL